MAVELVNDGPVVDQFDGHVGAELARADGAAMEKFMDANEGRDLRDKGNVKAVTRNVAT